jgi:hypothetical protein
MSPINILASIILGGMGLGFLLSVYLLIVEGIKEMRRKS